MEELNFALSAGVGQIVVDNPMSWNPGPVSGGKKKRVDILYA